MIAKAEEVTAEEPVDEAADATPEAAAPEEPSFF